MNTTANKYTKEEAEEQRTRLTRPDGTISIMEMIEDNKKNPPKGKTKRVKPANKENANKKETFDDELKKAIRTKQKKANSWHEIQGKEDKEEFKRIVQILCQYYNVMNIANKSDAHLFREKIVGSEIKDLRIFMKKFGKFEFCIVVEISSDSQSKKMDSWIHMDGISQEREIMKEKGKLHHPVFKIVSLNDLYQKDTTVSVKDLPKPPEETTQEETKEEREVNPIAEQELFPELETA